MLYPCTWSAASHNVRLEPLTMLCLQSISNAVNFTAFFLYPRDDIHSFAVGFLGNSLSESRSSCFN